MSTEENYLDNLLKSITDSAEDVLEDTVSEALSEEKEIKEEESVMDESKEEMEKMSESTAEDGTTNEPAMEESSSELDISDIAQEPAVLEAVDAADELELGDIVQDMEMPELLELTKEEELIIPQELETADIVAGLDISDAAQETEALNAAEGLEDGKNEESELALSEQSGSDALELPDVEELSIEGLDVSELPDAQELSMEGLDVSELPDAQELSIEGLDVSELPDAQELSMEGLDISELPDAQELSIEGLDVSELPDAQELSTESLDVPKLSDVEELSVESPDASKLPDVEELSIEEIDMSELPGLDINDAKAKVLESEESIPIEEASELVTDLDIGDIGEIGDLDLTEASDIGPVQEHLDDALNIEDVSDIIRPEEIARSETEPEMPDELNLDELDLDTPDLASSDTDDGLGILDDIDAKSDSSFGVDDGLDDVLSMLDDDADLAEINDILKKSDSNEPIQDEMMDLLNQMADDEAALVNAGVKDIEEDGGVPIPNVPIGTEEFQEGEEAQKSSKKKKNSDNAEKKPGMFGKLFNLLTEELPGPTEADYAAEEEKKAAKKQEALTKKEEEKIAKEEAKQAKAEEKEAAKKVKAEAAAQKKKEKEAAKAKKAAEKLAKQGPIRKAKRIPPKKIAAVAAFGVSVFGGILIASNVLSNQGYLNVAKKAFYDGDYKSVYLATYGMNLRDSDVALIQAKSEVILKMQRWYDAYENNLKIGQEREALDSLIRGIEAYDYLNAEAEACDALSDVERIKGTILEVLQSKYGLSEEQARDLLRYEDALDYTIALNKVITGK